MEIKKNYFYEKPTLPIEVSYKADFYSKDIIPHLPSPADLALIVERDHYDVAAQVFYNCLKNSTLFSRCIAQLEKPNESVSFEDRFQVFVVVQEDYFVQSDLCPSVVDFVHWVEDAGFEAIPLQLSRNQSISRQALEIDRLIAESGRKPSLLLSFGSSALAVRMWIEKKRHKMEAHLKGWLLLSGSLRGSLLAENHLRQPLKSQFLRLGAKLKGFSFEGLQEQRETYPVWRPVYLNSESFKVLSVFGVPRWTDIHPKLLGHARTLSPHGPSDGVNLLTHMIPHRGELYPLFGVDFTLRQVDRAALVRKVLAHMARQIVEEAEP